MLRSLLRVVSGMALACLFISAANLGMSTADGFSDCLEYAQVRAMPLGIVCPNDNCPIPYAPCDEVDWYDETFRYVLCHCGSITALPSRSYCHAFMYISWGAPEENPFRSGVGCRGGCVSATCALEPGPQIYKRCRCQ